MTASPLATTEANGVPVRWQGLSVAEIGETHLVCSPPLPRQDACSAVQAPRPALLVADGLGSRPLSQIGADALVRLLPCFLAGVEDLSQAFLDAPLAENEEAQTVACQTYARRLVRFAAAAIRDLGQRLGHSEQAFQSTLLTAVVGTVSVFWLRVGDGAIVFADPDGQLRTAGATDLAVAAGTTETIRTAAMREELVCGLEATGHVAGIAAFSDGAGERLIATDGAAIAGYLGKLLSALSTGALDRLQLLDFLRDRRVWAPTSRDDRCLALLAREAIALSD